jgi:acyl-CoA synthetase (NDP forming)
VNARYETLLGLKCYPGVLELPSSPEVVAFCMGSEQLPDILLQLANVCTC